MDSGDSPSASLPISIEAVATTKDFDAERAARRGAEDLTIAVVFGLASWLGIGFALVNLVE